MKIKKHKISELDQLFKDGYDIDCGIFSEHRNNSRLHNGDHYGSSSSYIDRNLKGLFKDSSKVIKVTENHINKIIKIIANSIKSQIPDVAVRPKNFDEPGDQKKAEMHRAVLEDWKFMSGFKESEMKLILEWVIFGEIYTKTIWDESAGRKLPDKVYTEIEYELDEEDETIEINEDGIKQKVVVSFEGDALVEKIYPFDIVRDASADSFQSSPWVAVKKLVPKETLKRKYKKDKEILEKINSSGKDEYQTYRVNGEYSKTDDMVLVKEMYFRPSHRYPDGYYYILAGSGKDAALLHDGELPARIFPIDQLGYDEISTSPRFASIIRQLRPNQLQINLMKSKMMEHVLKMGDDNVFIQKGTKLSSPTKRNGLKVHEFTGAPPVVQQGRVGAQYLDPITQNIESMYMKAGVDELLQGKNKQVDPHTALYLSAKQKSVFVDYVFKYETFLKRVYKKVLTLKKEYLPDEAIILITGKDEQVNVPEFKDTDDLGYEIALEGQSEDAETKLGRALDLQKVMQYAGNFEPQQLGAIIKNMPYLNNEEVYRAFTQDLTNAQNDILRLDRGDASALEISEYENHDFVIQSLIGRMKRPDFEFLNPQIKDLYKQKIQIHEQVKADQVLRTKALESDHVPSGGALLGIEGMYISAGFTTRGEPKTKKVRLPQEALTWLQDRLTQQGLQTEILENQEMQVQAEIADQVVQQQQQQILMQQEQVQQPDLAALEQLTLADQLGGL